MENIYHDDDVHLQNYILKGRNGFLKFKLSFLNLGKVHFYMVILFYVKSFKSLIRNWRISIKESNNM